MPDSDRTGITKLEVEMDDGTFQPLGIPRTEQEIWNPIDPTEAMRYKGVEIEESQDGMSIRLTAEMQRELDADELEMVQSSGVAGGAESGTVTRRLEATAADRQAAYEDIQEQIDEWRALGYR